MVLEMEIVKVVDAAFAMEPLPVQPLPPATVWYHQSHYCHQTTRILVPRPEGVPQSRLC